MVMMMIAVMRMFVMMDELTRTRAARILTEDEGFDSHWHRIGWHPDSPKIDIVEIPQDHAIDGKNLAFDIEFFAQNCAERLRYIAIEHEEERFMLVDARGQTTPDSLRKG